METMQMTIRIVAAVVLLIAAGCGGDDGRLADYARNSVDQQSRQNEQIARQNQEVTQQNRQVAEAARKLVEADARARQEMVTAQKSLQDGIRTERSNLDRQREDLELERKSVARQRYWEPVIGQAITGSCALLACLIPLVICYYALRHLHHDRDDETALNELLVEELMFDSPQRLLPPVEVPPTTPKKLPLDEPDRVDDAANAPASDL
jgi:hypothetical protein